MSDHSARPAGSIPPVHAGAPHRPASDPRRWWALVLLCLAQFMVVLDITVVNVALPTIGSDLQLDRTSLTWVVTTYTLCFGGLLLLGGQLADTLGRRRMFLAGLGVFTVASLASGLAQTGTVLVAARNRALGVWAAIAGAGAAVGVLARRPAGRACQLAVGILHHLPVGILLAAAAISLVAAVRPAHRARRLDLPGALAGSLATAAIIYGLVTAGSVGWGATTTLFPLTAGLVLAGGFVAVERTAREPLVPLGLVVRRPLLAGQLVMLATFVLDGAASVLVASVTGKPVAWPPIGALVTGIAGGWLVVAMWCLAGAFLGILVRGTALGVGIGLVWALAVENLLRIFGSIVEVVDVVQRFLPGTNAGALAAAFGVPVQGQPGGTPGVTDVVGGRSAALALVAYLAMFVAASAVLISRRDVT